MLRISKYARDSSRPRGIFRPEKLLDGIPYEFSLVRQRHDGRIADVPEPCSMAELVKLIPLTNLIQKLHSDTVLKRCFC